MSERNVQYVGSGGIGFWGLLGIIFITLKLIGVITWPWWLVLAPIWGPIVLIAIFTLGLVGCLIVAEVAKEFTRPATGVSGYAR